MNTQGFIPFTNFIHHGFYVMTKFVDAVTRKRVKKPITVRLAGVSTDLTIGEAKELMRDLESGLFRAEQYRAGLEIIAPDELKVVDREVVKASLRVVSKDC